MIRLLGVSVFTIRRSIVNPVFRTTPATTHDVADCLKGSMVLGCTFWAPDWRARGGPDGSWRPWVPLYAQKVVRRIPQSTTSLRSS